MPLLPIEDVEPGSYLGHTIYAEDGRPLLQRGVRLTQSYIRRLTMRGYKSLFVLSEAERDVELQDVISPVLRQNAQQILFNTFNTLTNGRDHRDIETHIHRMDDVVDLIVEELQYHDTLVADLVNLKCVSSYTLEHSVNVGILGAMVGFRYGLNRKEVRNLLLAGLFHDIGKLFVPDEILNKPGKLTDEEFEEMRSHPEKGFQLLHYQFDVDPIISVGSWTHHERWDGNGYPKGMTGEEIHKFGRILAAVDVYDAMTSDRVYREGLPPDTVLEYIRGESGSHFEPKAVQTVNKTIFPFPTGVRVHLSTGEEAIVVENHPRALNRPTVRVLNSRTEYDLSAEADISIKSQAPALQLV